jgi:amidohydrolase
MKKWPGGFALPKGIFALLCGMKFSTIAFFLLALAASPLLRATPSPKQLADQELPSLLAIYKDMHSHPELSTQEERTSALVAKELKAAGCEVTDHIGKYDQPGLTGYGVVGVMKNGDRPVVLVRTDLDALPVEEETGLPYASKVTAKNNAGEEVHVMHACGHDVHIATFIGVARALAKLKDQWHGTIVFVGQPAEEAVGGARAMLKDGLYQRFPKPDYALGFHDNAQMEIGHIGVTSGYTYANVDSVDVSVPGVGGHGAYPHKTKDPVVLSAEIINLWQTIASRENNPIDPIVITVGSIHGGTKHNIIPNEVKMQLTVRTYKSDVRERVLAAIDQIAKGCAIASGWPQDKMPQVHVRRDEFVSATYNNPELTKRLIDNWKTSLGEENVEIVDPTMGGEDFSEFSLPDHSIPAVDFHVGAVAPAKIAASKKPGAPPLPSLHSSKFAPVPEPTIRTGMIAMTSAVLDLMKK